MVKALRELFAKSKHPSHDDKESAAHTLASIIEQAQAIGHAHAQDEHERSIAWGGKFTDALSSAWDIVSNFVQRIGDWISGQNPEDLTEGAIVDQVDTLAETVSSVEVPSAIEGAVMDSLQSQGFLTIAWIAQPGACERCLANAAASPLPIGSEWPSGDTIPPVHPHCRCSIGVPANEGE